MDERARIARIAELLAARADGVDVGIGDDAAVLTAPGNGKLVWTIDEQVEGVHFRRAWLSWRDVGWRSFMAAASDLAAMGASPWCALASLVLPGDVDDAALEAIVGGQRDAAAEVGAPVVGGNLARGAALSLTTTLLGRCERPVLRSGARPGDGLWMAGDVGMAAAGMRALELGRGDEPLFARAVEAWRTPRALVAEGRHMARTARAAIDVSDGLARDAAHLGEASGVAIVLDEAALLDEGSLVDLARALGADPLALALHGGEDYAVVVSAPSPILGFRHVGDVRDAADVRDGSAGGRLFLRSATGERPIEPGGFDHFGRGLAW
jgi:thiamine-monophosphate kinase